MIIMCFILIIKRLIFLYICKNNFLQFPILFDFVFFLINIVFLSERLFHSQRIDLLGISCFSKNLIYRFQLFANLMISSDPVTSVCLSVWD